MCLVVGDEFFGKRVACLSIIHKSRTQIENLKTETLNRMNLEGSVWTRARTRGSSMARPHWSRIERTRGMAVGDYGDSGGATGSDRAVHGPPSHHQPAFIPGHHLDPIVSVRCGLNEPATAGEK
jgi:hypothetical protein